MLFFEVKGEYEEEEKIPKCSGAQSIYSLWNAVRAKTHYWGTAMPRFGREPHVWIHVLGWSVNELFCLEAPKGGFVLIVGGNLLS